MRLKMVPVTALLSARGDCWQAARARANMAAIANEWRQQEKYKYYQRCLVKRGNSTS